MPPPAPDAVKSFTADPEKSVKSVTRLAEVLGITRPTVYDWLEKEPSLEKQTDGAFDVAAWREFARRQGSKTAAGADDDKNALQCEDLRLRNAERAYNFEVRKGLYKSVSEVRAEIAALVNEAKSVLRAKLEQELPAQLVGLTAAEIRNTLKTAVVEVCERLSRSLPCVANAPAAPIEVEDVPAEPEAAASA